MVVRVDARLCSQVGLINKPTLNICDDAMTKKAGSTGFVLVTPAWLACART